MPDLPNNRKAALRALQRVAARRRAEVEEFRCAEEHGACARMIVTQGIRKIVCNSDDSHVRSLPGPTATKGQLRRAAKESWKPTLTFGSRAP